MLYAEPVTAVIFQPCEHACYLSLSQVGAAPFIVTPYCVHDTSEGK